MPLEHTRRSANGLGFHVVEAGRHGDPLVLLLHGFPEFWYSWRHQLPALAAAGFHVAAPDQRGYAESDKPSRVADYDIDLLANDAAGMIRALGGKRAVVIGHDWGGAVGWHLASRHPDLVERLAVLACPHPQLLARALLSSPQQRRRSLYMLLFQIPFLPERALAGARLRALLRGWSASEHVFSDVDLARYEEAFDHPGAMRGAMSWYRAALRRWPRTLRERPAPVRCPTLVLWGELDPILGTDLLDGTDRFVDGPLDVEVVPGLGHFLHQQAPDRIDPRLLQFIRGTSELETDA